MSKINHTPTPWWADEVYIYGGSGDCGFYPRIADTSVADGDECGMSGDESDANAARIVRCVNGCSGIADPARSVPDLIAALSEALDTLRQLGEDCDLCESNSEMVDDALKGYEVLDALETPPGEAEE